MTQVQTASSLRARLGYMTNIQLQSKQVSLPQTLERLRCDTLGMQHTRNIMSTIKTIHLYK